ncbi:AAA family ATPase [soil metagenome]
MRLRRVRLENVRGVDACELAFRDDGVTIVEAPNESGKTTLIEAMDVLFEYKDGSRSSEVRGLQPVGRDVGSTVEVELTCGGTHLTCSKTFNRQSQTELHIHSPRPEQLTGAEAHDRLRQILESDVDMALYEALRMSQGRDLDAISLGGSDVLSARLDAAAGGSGTSGGDALLQRAKEVYETYYTEKTGNPKKILTDLDSEVSGLETDRDELDVKVKALQADVDWLEVVERDLPNLERRMKEELAPAVARQEELLGRVRSVQERHATRVAERDTAEAGLREARRARDERVESAKNLTDLEDETVNLRREHDPQKERLAGMEKDLARREEALTGANKGTRNARRQREVQEWVVDLIRARRELERLRTANERIQEITQEADTARKALAGTVLDDELLAEIKDADEKVKLARATLSAGAPSLELRAHSDLEVELDGSASQLTSGDELSETIGERLTLHVPGTLDLEVRAGTSASDLHRRVADAETSLEDVCERAGVADLDGAETAAKQRRRHEDTLERQDEALARELGDETRDDFANRLREAETTAEAIEGRVPEDAEVPDPSTADERLAAAREAEEAALEAAEEARKAREEAAEALRLEGDAASKGTARLEAREEEAVRLRNQLEVARGEKPDEDLEESVAKAAEAHRLAEAALDEVQAELNELEPASVEFDTEAARTARDNTATRIRERREERIRLESSLQTAGAEGLGERLEKAEASLKRARSGQRRRWARAKAAREFYVTLREAREEAYREYREPLRQRIVEGARQLYRTDDLDVELDDELRIEKRTMDGTTLDWDQLSAGAREQLAILTALAAARLAGDDGAPFVLDDALGYTDPVRLERLGQLLGRTEGAQVIVLTCVADRFQYVGGARTVRLRDTLGERRD